MSAETTTGVHAVHVPATLEEFMLHALAMERDAIERYTDFADQMETHNNGEVAAMFRTMAGYETKHAQEIMDQMGWKEPPVLALQGVRWAGFDKSGVGADGTGGFSININLNTGPKGSLFEGEVTDL